MTALSSIEKLCLERGMKMTGQRRVIAQVLSASDDHPNVDEVFGRASDIDPNISIATVYRTVRLFEEAGLLEKHDFGGKSARYEEATGDHHDHLINVKNEEVIEFRNEEIEVLQRKIAKEKGLKLIGHRLELYGIPISDDEKGQ
jgi:Fur family transcriptional regulator, ferric uptake regulator